MRENTFAFDYARAVLEVLPKGSALFLYVDQDLGPFSYARYGARVREDVRLYSQYGHLFGNRIYGAEDADFGKAQTALMKFLDGEDKNRLFVTFPSELFHAQPEHGVYLHDHGYFHELSRSEAKTDLELPSGRARAFLDRHWPDAYANLWTYHRQVIAGTFCHALMIRDETHPAFERHDFCKTRLAQYLVTRQEHERSAKLFRDLFATGTPWPKHELAHAYFKYLIAELAVINQKPPASRTSDVQRLIDEVYPATTIWPTCDNQVVKGLLTLGAQGPVDVHLDELTETFGHCDNWASLFKRARRTRQ